MGESTSTGASRGAARYLAWSPEAKYRSLFDSIDEGFCVIEVLFDGAGKPVDYVFLDANPNFVRQTGLADAVGRTMRSIAPAHEDHWFRIYGDVARTGESVRFEAPAAALGRWYDVNAFRVGAPGDNLVGVLFNDVSARKQLEQGLRESHEAMRDADARKDQFLAALAHELRNPLAPLRVAADILANPVLSPAQLTRTGDVIRRQVSHMARLLDDLLDVARITQGKLALRREPARVADVVDGAVEAVRPLIDRKQHVLRIELPEPGLLAVLDPVRVSQVIANLLANAAKYSDAGGSIELRAAREDSMLRIDVRDQGIGIVPQEIPRLFELFAQQQDLVNRSEGGLGVGLALVKGIADLHGGRASATSEGPGKGSTFSVWLPLGDAAEAGATPTVRTRTQGEAKVLVVDDNRDAADMLQALLGQSGHDVRVAYDGQSALAVARAFQPDLAVLDLGMPGMDGHELATRLRSEPWAGTLVLAAVTGWGDAQARQKALGAGFAHHFVKPVDPSELEDLLARVATKVNVPARET